MTAGAGLRRTPFSDVDVKGNHADVKGNRVDAKGNRVDIKRNRADAKGLGGDRSLAIVPPYGLAPKLTFERMLGD
eukprot:682241-Pyramimonas_sp.AAC.1